MVAGMVGLDEVMIIAAVVKVVKCLGWWNLFELA